MKILVVDDDEATRSTLARVIASLGHHVATAADGVEALRMHRHAPVDVVISDWHMPRMPGDELCRRLRAFDGDDRYTYVVIMTAHGDDELLMRSMRSGADEYLPKPIELHRLEAQLVGASRVLERDKRRSERAAMLRRDSVRLLAAAHTDVLTGVANRRLLDEDLQRIWKTAMRYDLGPSLAIVDVDHFKAYNDRFGHLAGDDVLRAVARTLAEQMRAGDRVYRYGGEEFVAVLPDASDGRGAAERLCGAVRSMSIPHPGEPKGVVTVSVGVARLDAARDRSVEDWLARADAALYAAKNRGRDAVIVADAGAADVKESSRLGRKVAGP